MQLVVCTRIMRNAAHPNSTKPTDIHTEPKTQETLTLTMTSAHPNSNPNANLYPYHWLI